MTPARAVMLPKAVTSPQEQEGAQNMEKITFMGLWDDILLSPHADFKLLDNGYDIENCDTGYLYLNKNDESFLEVGYKHGALIHIAFKKEI